MSTQKRDSSEAKSSSRPAVGKSTRRTGALSQSRHGRNIFASGVSRTTSGSRKSTDGGVSRHYRPPVRITDDYGQDITPLPLLAEDKKVHDTSKETPTDMMSQASMQQTAMSVGGSSVQGGVAGVPVGFTRSRSQMSSSVTRTSDTHSEIGSEDIGVGDQGTLNALWTEMKTRPQQEEHLTEEDLDKIVEIELTESDTFWMFDQAPVVVSNETEEAADVKLRNEKYEALLKDKIGNDKYSDRGMNTFDNHLITKTLQTDKIVPQDKLTQVTTWDMYDSYMEEAERARQAALEGEGVQKEEEVVVRADDEVVDADADPEAAKSGGSVDTAKKSPGRPTHATVASMGESEFFGTIRGSTSITATVSADDQTRARNETVLRSDTMKQSLFVMERAIVLNNSQTVLANYRGLPLLEMEVMMSEEQQQEQALLQQQQQKQVSLKKQSRPSSGAQNPTLYGLWKYTCTLTKGRNISSMAWNRANPDILAAGYGQHEYTGQRSGLVVCWSVKNIQYPERVWNLPSGVTALDWNRNHPSLLAVGMYDGVIYVFDARQSTNEPVIDTHDSPGRHLGPVRCLEWVLKDGGTAEEAVEVLVSISSDGRVTQWSIRKGFEHSDLMRLKRIAMKVPGAVIKSKERRTDALISRFAFGTSISFNKHESNIYLAATEDGHIHKCSCSYNEQYLESYSGHTGPVYGLKWSPFINDIFLSCAADWTIKLWHMEHTEPIINFQSAAKSVNALCWSPNSSVVFAVVNDGALEVWNLAASTLDPIITEHNLDSEIKATSVLFAKNSQSILVGDSEGSIHVYKLENMPDIPKNQSEALDRIIHQIIYGKANE